MLDTLIPSKTRLRLLLRFFLNPESSAYLRGLAQDFNESTNSVRVELNRFEEAGLISSQKVGNKKMYKVNTDFPLFSEFQNIAFKHFGIDKIVDQVLCKIGEVETVFLTGDLAKGLDSPVIDITLIGDRVNTEYLARLVVKAELLVNRKIRTIVYNKNDFVSIEKPSLLIYGEEY